MIEDITVNSHTVVTLRSPFFSLIFHLLFVNSNAQNSNAKKSRI